MKEVLPYSVDRMPDDPYLDVPVFQAISELLERDDTQNGISTSQLIGHLALEQGITPIRSQGVLRSIKANTTGNGLMDLIAEKVANANDQAGEDPSSILGQCILDPRNEYDESGLKNLITITQGNRPELRAAKGMSLVYRGGIAQKELDKNRGVDSISVRDEYGRDKALVVVQSKYDPVQIDAIERRLQVVPINS